MKNLMIVVCFLSVSSIINAQGGLLIEHFDYAAGDELRNNSWTPHSAAATNPLLVHDIGLSFSTTDYLGSGVGLSAIINNTGSDENKPFSNSVNSGSLYASFLMKAGGEVTTDGSGFFFHFATYSNTSNPSYSSISSAFRARTFITEGSTSGKFRLGLTFNSASVPSNVGTDLTDDLDISNTYLVVVKYTFVDGDDNDEVSLFVFEDGDNIDDEPTTPALGPYGGTAADASTLQAIALRQYNAEQNVIIDGIYVTTEWDFKSPPLGADEPLTESGISIYPNPLSSDWLNIYGNSSTPLNFSIFDNLGKLIKQSIINDQQLYLGDLNTGIYLIRMEQEGKYFTKKLIIQ